MRALGELVGWTIRAAGHAGRELDGVYLYHRHDEFRCRMVGKPIAYSPLQLLTGTSGCGERLKKWEAG
jgi:hypothetical protein